jgi:DNA polymerase-3 subunit delta'
MAEKRLSHAYLLIGPDGEARQEAAVHLAAELLCGEPDAPCGRCRNCRKVFAGIHPDVMTVERRPGDKGALRREILVDQIREITSDAVVMPNEADRKVYIIREADRMNIAAQNALLKALEDPPGHACFLLCAAAADALLPTVRSRCVRQDDTPREDETAELSEFGRAFLEIAAAGDRAEMVRFFLLRARLEREEADELLAELETALSDILCRRREDPGLGTETVFRMTETLRQGREYLRRNVSARQVFGLLAAEMI